jgi:hypothetical protein
MNSNEYLPLLHVYCASHPILIFYNAGINGPAYSCGNTITISLSLICDGNNDCISGAMSGNDEVNVLCDSKSQCVINNPAWSRLSGTSKLLSNWPFVKNCNVPHAQTMNNEFH